MKKVTESLIFSAISYCLPLFGHELRFQRILQKLVNSAARLVLKRGPRSSATEMLRDLSWLNVRNLYFLESVCWLDRVIATKSAPYTFETILRGSQKKQKLHNTRDSSIVIDFDYKSKYARQTFVYNAVQTINSLKLQRRTVPLNTDYREFVKNAITAQLGNGNL